MSPLPALNCTAAAGPSTAEQALCAFVQYSLLASGPSSCPPSQYASGSVCLSYASPVQKTANLLGDSASVVSGNTAWVLTSCAYIMIMGPAIGMFYSGLVNVKAAGNTVAMSLVAMALVAFQWFLFGYSFAYGPGTETMGSFQWGAFTSVFELPSGVYSVGVPHVIFACLQCQYAAFAASILAGSVVERVRFTRWCLFVFIWTTIVYDVFCHWMWSWQTDPTLWVPVPFGWLANGQHSELAAVDSAGGIVVFVVAGASGLALALVLGPRKTTKDTPKPHDVPFAMVGAGVLWFAWLSFCGASAWVSGSSAAQAVWNAQLCASCSMLMWMALEKVVGGSPSPVGGATGAIVGLVAISSGCTYVTYWGALITGFAVAPIVFFAQKLRKSVGPDDTLDVFVIFGLGGATGAFCTGIFANGADFMGYPVVGAVGGYPKLIGYELVAVVVAFLYSFIVTGLLAFAIDKTVGFRIAEDKEISGIDAAEHGGMAYAKAGTANAMG